MAGDSTTGGGDLTGVLGGGGDGGRCFSMTCNWNASIEEQDSPQAEQYIGGLLASIGGGDATRGGGSGGIVDSAFLGGGGASSVASGRPSLSSPSSSADGPFPRFRRLSLNFKRNKHFASENFKKTTIPLVAIAGSLTDPVCRVCGPTTEDSRGN